MSTALRTLMSRPAAPEISRHERSAESQGPEACVETARTCLVAADSCAEEDAVTELLAHRA